MISSLPLISSDPINWYPPANLQYKFTKSILPTKEDLLWTFPCCHNTLRTFSYN